MTFRYSVVIPAYNAEDTIQPAIASVLQQTILPRAIIVVDDGSTDETASVVRGVAPQIDLVRQPNQGPGAATNAGLLQVKEPFVAMLDADDLWLPEKIERQAECLKANPEVDGVFSLARVFKHAEEPQRDGDGSVQRLWTRTTMIYRMDAARAIGEFVDLPGRLGETVDWLARGRDLGHRHVMLEEILAFRRQRAGSLTFRRDAEKNRGYLLAARRAMLRKKQLGSAAEGS